jgi:SAM-dependent methyltransferase
LKRRYFSPEYRYRVLGDLRGKRVLDVGCGEGTNAVILAKLGAIVTGIDISQGAIDAATQRAKLNGVESRVRFECSPLELANFQDGEFDIVWGEAILHHLLADLESSLAHLASWTSPDGMMLFAEPVVLSHALRRIRMMVPIRTDATPDERPLETGELSIVSRYLRNAQVRYFDFLGRLDRFVIPNENFEQASRPRQLFSTALRVADYGLLSIPFIRSLAGSCVIYGQPAAPTKARSSPAAQ